ncbi:DNA-binding domain-containing protein [Phaeobacter sp. J2-8]|uniref:HvfC/BufC N-terminal domain-containing protein n=1 Tax=Phaeobacter sp. J2-8 TaxID=2931394 RepID=UPI001FD38081|nr:DNA-binding domain-containing protein [Phaeobacter sp. J2-8]MCJ7874905.1 putative DNA-binding domain-containing protein [Phaeobacter sp. J2-8]
MTTQADFRAALLDASAEIPTGLQDGAGRPAGRRYDVYRNNIATSLGDALLTGFPAVAKLLGEVNFKNLAAMYLRAAPPDSARMMYFGHGFGDFLQGFAPLAKYPYLGDVARLEFGLRESYHAADHVPVAAEALAIAPEELMAARLGLAPSLRLLRSSYPVVSLWAYNMRPGAPKPQGVAEDALILRAEFDPEPHVLAPGGADFITALQADATLGTAYEAALAQDPGFDLSPLLGLLLGANALTYLKKDTK